MADNNDNDDVPIIDEDGGDGANPVGELQQQLEKSQKDYLYLRAEFDNYRKNVIKERSDLVKYGSEGLIRELVNLQDTIDMALSTELNENNIEAFRKGLELVSQEFRSTLTRFGVKEENPEGKPFDPSLHEALSSETTSAVPPGHITRVFKKAYRLHDRLVRPAQVVVAQEPKDETPPSSTQEGE